MERYKVINDDVLDQYHKVLAAAGCLGYDNNNTVEKDEFFDKVIPGLQILREKKPMIYDSFFGSAFCIGLADDYVGQKFVLAEPENESYDLTVLISNINDEGKYKIGNVLWYDRNTVVKLELTELKDLSDSSIQYLCDNKLGNKHDYKGRILLIVLSVIAKQNLELIKLSYELKKFNKNFKNIWIIANTRRVLKDSHEYLIAELIQTPIKERCFKIPIDFSRIIEHIHKFSK